MALNTAVALPGGGLLNVPTVWLPRLIGRSAVVWGSWVFQ